MTLKIKRIIILFELFCLPAHVVFSQSHPSKDNYTGAWDAPSSWNPTWTVPQTTNLSGYNITINGYITVNESLLFSGTASNLIINDTLVIKGDLLLENNTVLTINDNGILIIRGNLTISNQSILKANGYLIVSGNIIKNGSDLQGPFTSNDNPVKLFVGGIIYPIELTDNYPNFPVLNCTAPPTTPYPNTTCSYGNMTDIKNDPINTFFQYTCKTANVKSNSSVCVANTINLTSASGTAYIWSGPNNFTSNLQNPNITNAVPAMAGDYTITVIAAPGCMDKDTINLTVVALPATPTITAGSPTTFCTGGSVTLTSSAGTSYLWSNGATTPDIIVTTEGSYTVSVKDASGCQSATSATKAVTVNALPVIPTISAGGPTAFCAGGSVTLTSSAGTSYLWSNGATTPGINVTTAGNYTVRVTDLNGCQSTASVPIIVTVNALPVTPTISADGPTTFCAGGSVTLSSGAGSTYLWSTGATTASINITTAGSYTVKVTDANGCQSVTSVATAVTVNALPAIPTIAAGGTTTFCAGGSVTLTSSTGSTYLWSTGATTLSININKSGSYTVKVANATGCQSLASVATAVTVNSFPAIPTITAGGPTTFCAGGSVTLTSGAGTSYLWSNGATTPNINVTAAGSYTVQVANAGGCQSPASVATIVTVNDLPAPTIGAGGPTTFCEGGSVNLTLTSGTGTSYLWSNAATTPDINITTSGSYTLQVTNSSGCQSASSAATIVNVIALPVVNAGIDAIIPSGSGTTIDATVTGTGPFTYSWSPSALLTDASIEDPTIPNLATTTVFTLTATSITTGCSNTNSVTITISGGALSSTPTATPGTICAGANVQLNAMASGGSGIYTYTWTSIPAGFTSPVADPTANPLDNTTYNVAVYDESTSTTVISQVAVTVNALPLTPTITADGPTTFCSGGSEILILTSGAAKSYLWSNGATSPNINVNTSGSYTIQVTNDIGCLSAASEAIVVTVNTPPVVPTITASGPTAFCTGGSVKLTSSAGSTYIWSNAETTPNIDVTTAGSYTVRVTDASGCLSTGSVATVVTVNALPVIPTITAASSTTFCAGGSVTLTSSAETSYLWSNAATTPTINVTTAGSYTVRVKNANGCQSTASVATIVTVNALPATPTISASGPITFCEGGSVTLTSSAGTSYLWSNGATTSVINITKAGSFTVKVTNASGCQSAASAATIVTVNALPVIPTITAGGPTAFCTGGRVTLTSSAGTGYLWSNTATTPGINVTTSGSYTVQVTNANGCQSAESVATIVTVNALPSASITKADNSGLANNDGIICNGTSATLTASGGTFYSWSSGETTAAIVKGIAGTYTVTVTNANGCTDTEATNITVNAVPIATAGSNSPVCELNTINLTSSGGKDYSWSGPDGFTSDNQSDKQNPKIHFANKVNEGIYTVTVTNTNGCTAKNTTSVIVNPLPIVTARSNSPVCVGNTINLTSSDGTGYIYSWKGPNGFISILQNPSRSPADTTMSGAYKLTVTAVTGCSTDANKVIVKVNALPIASITITDNSGIANNDGIICNGANATLTASGGTSYKWSSGETTAAITKGTAGTYTVTVTNANGCTGTKAATITVNALPVAAITLTDNSGIANNDGIICNGVSATLTASGGTSYIWSSGETTAAITKGTAGTYTVTVTNANGCTDTAPATVVVNALPAAEASNNGPVFSLKALDLTGGPEGMTTYSWTGPSGFTSNSQSPSVSASALAAMAGVYTLTVTNASACTNTATTTVEINEFPVPSVITPNSDGKNDYFVIGEIIDQVELTIFNRWGNEEYINSNYSNDWDGRNNKGAELPNDIYFYILKFESGKIIKGSVLIKR